MAGLAGLRALMRRSLILRVTVAALVAGAVLITVLLGVVTVTIRESVFSDKRDAVLADAMERVRTAQAVLDAATVTSPDEVAFLAQTQVTSIRGSSAGAGGVGVALRRSGSESSSVAINDLSTDAAMDALVTHDITQAVEDAPAGTLAWRPTQVPASIGTQGGSGQEPGVLVGTRLSLPVAGQYDVYVLYTLAPEQRLVTVASRAVITAGVGFALVTVLGVWTVTARVLRPVRQTSLAAQRLASGTLSERIEVRGEDELAGLATSFNTMAASLQAQIERYAALSTVQRLFVSDVSHELRTPLTTIRMASDQLYAARTEIEDPLARRSAELLNDQVDRFQTMLTDLLEISRIDSGRVELRVSQEDLREVVRRVLSAVEVHVTASGAQVHLDLGDQPATAQMDVTRVERIVRNLVTNAIEHAEGSVIDVTVATSSNAVALRVRDHGVGMSPDVVAKVFDRFYRAEPSRRRTLGGTGLGLSIALEDAHLHGGTLTAWGWPADGSSFLLVLPRVLGEDGTPGTLTGAPPLEVVPPDAPAVARTSAGHTSAGQWPGPVSRRTGQPGKSARRLNSTLPDPAVRRRGPLQPLDGGAGQDGARPQEQDGARPQEGRSRPGQEEGQ